jgi:hypothetical protein
MPAKGGTVIERAMTPVKDQSWWPLVSHVPILGALPTAPGAARSHVRAALETWRVNDDNAIDAAELIVSEFVTNAVAASSNPMSGTPVYLASHIMMIAVDVFSDGRCVRIDVWDQAVGVPKFSPLVDDDAESGRGLAMVDHLTSHRWGWTCPDSQGWKCVWAEVDVTPAKVK